MNFKGAEYLDLRIIVVCPFSMIGILHSTGMQGAIGFDLLIKEQSNIRCLRKQFTVNLNVNYKGNIILFTIIKLL